MAPAPLTRKSVSSHNNIDDLWCIIDHKVYDLTDFADAHPGGSVVLAQVAGQDATAAFYNLHRQEVLVKYQSLCIGTVEGETPEVITQNAGDLSVVPYAEPMWLTKQFKTPYYKETHRQFQKALRVFVDKYVTPEAQEKEISGEYISQELIDRMAEEGILAMRLGPGKHLHGKKLIGGTRGEDYDSFHDLILCQEMVRANARGFMDGNMAGMSISLTAVMEWLGDAQLKQKVMGEVLSGKKKICLAVTEAFAGSDVAGLKTTATKSEDGKHYIINGTKKWITNGMFCDYFVTGCKTDKGFSVILVPKQEGVSLKPIKTAYSPAAATTFIEYDNVKVPVNHLLGQEHQGFKVIMSNFNHERFMMACLVCRHMRLVVEECLKWSNQRLVFGKRLIDQPVIRAKLAKMIAHVESGQAWLESITYQMANMSYKEQSLHLGGPIALLKYHLTRSANVIADESVNIFGGRGITQTGMGRFVEMFNRTYKFDAILGGTEEILSDLAVRQAMRGFPKAML